MYPLQVFNKGGSTKLDVPQPPSSLPPPPSIISEMDKTQRYAAIRQKLQYKRKKAEMYSLWCDCLYRLSLANHVSKQNILKIYIIFFFFPVQKRHLLAAS